MSEKVAGAMALFGFLLVFGAVGGMDPPAVVGQQRGDVCGDVGLVVDNHGAALAHDASPRVPPREPALLATRT